MAVHNRGWFDTRANIGEILQADEFLKSLIFRNLNDDTLTTSPIEVVIAAVTIVSHARYPANRLAVKSREYIDSIVVGEMMAPVLPTINFLGQTAARHEFEKIMAYLLTTPTVHNRNKGYNEWVAALREANAELALGDQHAIVARDNMQFIDYVEYLIWLAYNTPSSMYMNAVVLVVSSYVGIAKRGTMSDHFADKVTSGIRDDLGIDITLDSGMIKYAYINFGRYVNADNARAVFNRWLDDIPEHALRLRLSLEQVTGSGLTAYIVIGRCMRKYNDFPWDRLNVLTDGEVDKFVAAMLTVNGNLYFGFNRNLGVARSTLYSSVAYVAKELLIRVAGETSLTKYQGWLKRPKNPAAVQVMIESYITQAQERLAQVADAAVDVQYLEHLIRNVNLEAHNDIVTKINK